MKKPGMGLLIGLSGAKASMGGGESSGDEGPDVLAARAVMKALKRDDAAGFAEAFREMMDCCKGESPEGGAEDDANDEEE